MFERFTDRARRVAVLAQEEAGMLRQDYIGTEHILLGLIREGEGVAAQVLVKLGADPGRVRRQVIRLLAGSPGSEPAAAGAPPGAAPSASVILDQFGRNLTAAAREGRLDPVIGREKEIERVMQVLCRRTKNNPVLVGEPGVGKTAVVEGLAQKIVQGDPGCLGVQELPPGRARTARRGIDACGVQDLPHCGRRDRNAQLGELTVDAAVSPRRFSLARRTARRAMLRIAGAGRACVACSCRTCPRPACGARPAASRA